MTDFKVFLVRYYNEGYLCKSIVVAENYKEAKSILVNEYKYFNVEIEIEEYLEIDEKGIALTECVKL